MKKVRVLKEMPFAEVGKELTISEGQDQWLEPIRINELVKRGWLEWVEEEKILEERFAENCEKLVIYEKNAEVSELIKCLWKEHAQIAKKHFLAALTKYYKENPTTPNSGAGRERAGIYKELEDC